MRAFPLPSLCVAAATIVAVIALAPATVAAAKNDQAAVDKVTGLNKKALDAYGKQDFDAARALLKEALEVCASAGLDTHPITARTHIHFGVVAIAGFKQRQVGIKQFRKALDIQPDIKLTKSLVTPDLQDAFEEAVLAGDGPPGGTAAGGGDDGSGGSGGPSVQADDGGDEGGSSAPRARKPPPRKKPGGDDDDKDDEGGQSGAIFVAVGIGTGLGLASGNGVLDPNMHKLSNAGFAMAQLAQIVPEVGFFLNKDLLLSAALRLQYVTGLNGKPGAVGCGSDMFCTPSTTAAAGFARVTYLIGGSPHFMVGGQIGGGYIRHAVVFPTDTTCKASATSATTQQCVDTLNGGPFLVGPTAGMMFELGSSVDLILAINTALGVPNFTFNLDIQAGIGFRL
jgi:hypothetical protein